MDAVLLFSIPFLDEVSALAAASASRGAASACLVGGDDGALWRSLCSRASGADGTLFCRSWRVQHEAAGGRRLALFAKLSARSTTAKGNQIAGKARKRAAAPAPTAGGEGGGAKTKVLHGQPVKTFYYGEAPFATLERLFADVRRATGHTLEGEFVDLGCGTGKVVFGAALLGGFSRASGVELLPDLHAESVGLREVWDEKVAPLLEPRRAATVIDLACGDLTVEDWSQVPATPPPRRHQT